MILVSRLRSCTGARLFRRAATIDEIEQQPDDLSDDEKDLRAVGQADEQIDAAKDAEYADRPGRRRPELAFAPRLALPEDEHRRTDGDERRQRAGIGQG